MVTIHAIDFDGTLVEDKYPSIGDPLLFMFEYFIECKKRGDKLILWTCRCGELLTEAVAFCAKHGLVFDAVNTNIPENIAEYGNDCRKVFAHRYYDDKAARPLDVYNLIKLRRYKV